MSGVPVGISNRRVRKAASARVCAASTGGDRSLPAPSTKPLRVGRRVTVSAIGSTKHAHPGRVEHECRDAGAPPAMLADLPRNVPTSRFCPVSASGTVTTALDSAAASSNWVGLDGDADRRRRGAGPHRGDRPPAALRRTEPQLAALCQRKPQQGGAGEDLHDAVGEDGIVLHVRQIDLVPLVEHHPGGAPSAERGGADAAPERQDHGGADGVGGHLALGCEQDGRVGAAVAVVRRAAAAPPARPGLGRMAASRVSAARPRWRLLPALAQLAVLAAAVLAAAEVAAVRRRATGGAATGGAAALVPGGAVTAIRIWGAAPGGADAGPRCDVDRRTIQPAGDGGHRPAVAAGRRDGARARE